MGRVELSDILALAEREEADEVSDIVNADPLNFRWGSPIPL
jgi:hypothetical protein